MPRENILYALLTTQCNLSCPYCDIKDKNDNYNQERFFKQLEEFDGRFILFGGEPTMHRDRLFKIINDPKLRKKIRSITTNLMILNDELISFYQQLRSIATSWNPSRFNLPEYTKWLANIDRLAKAGNIKISILVVMTDDLLNMPIDYILNTFSSWDHSIIDNICFEPYVGEYSDESYFERVDKFLCEIYSKWDVPIKLRNVDRVKNYYFDCSNVFTLHPNGEVTSGCPHNMIPTTPNKCYSCELSDTCKPCQLQNVCSFPKQFAKLVAERSTGRHE